jgi:hypothetical protein
MPDQRDTNAGWITWLQWTLLTTLGWSAAMGLSTLLPANLHMLLSPIALMVSLVFVTLAWAAGIAALQWLALRRYFSGAMKWILASSAGVLIGSAVAMPLKLRDLYMGPSGFQLDEVMYGVVFGILLGAAQWLVLRTLVRNSGWWIVSNAVGWTLGMTVGELLPLDWNSTHASFVYTVVTESIPTAVTGIALVMLLRNPLHGASVMKNTG